MTVEIHRYQLLERSRSMPSSCKGRYCRIAVVEVDPEVLAALGRTEPAMISERARGLVRIIEEWDKLPADGATMKSAYQRARSEAAELVERLREGDQ